MPFSTSSFAGLGTAPAIESIDLGDDVPIAVNPNEIAREAVRYVFFAGDIMPPTQKEERSDLRLGGEYFGQEYKTLVRSKGLVRKCQITPLEIGFDFMGDEQIGDNATGLQVVSQVTHADPVASDSPALPKRSRLSGIQIYPGEQIRGILHGNSNGTNKGFVEIRKLAGVLYDDFRTSGVQEFIFPDWKKILAGAADLPVKLASLVTHLNERRTATSDADIRSIIDDMLLSCTIHRRWGLQYLKYASALVRVPAYQGHVNTYSDLAEMLFTVLDVRREDMLADVGTQEIAARLQAGNVTAQDSQVLLDRLIANQELLTQVLLGKAPKVGTTEIEEVESMPKEDEIRYAAVQGTPEPTPLDPTKCEVITGSGVQCANDADETGRCKHPAHKL